MNGKLSFYFISLLLIPCNSCYWFPSPLANFLSVLTSHHKIKIKCLSACAYQDLGMGFVLFAEGSIDSRATLRAQSYIPYVYSEVNPIMVNGSYSQASGDRFAT